MPRIAVDAMGGDNAPAEVVSGCVDAAREGIDVVLVGDRQKIAPLVHEMSSDLPIVHAPEVIGMDEDPARAIRDKKESSIAVAARLVDRGEAEGMVSAGSTGASLASAAFIIGRLHGVSRPAIASIFPTGHIILDAGANLDVRPEHLVQFAVMGTAVAAVHAGLEDARVGLLNIGEEDGKGRELEKRAFDLLEAAPGVNFIGNVEGRELANDTVDVFVTDGFTGNVLLKTGEGVGLALYEILLEALGAEEYREPLQELMPVFRALRLRLDSESVGGAHLVGVRGVVVIAHGSSSRVAIGNAVAMAADGVKRGLVDRIAAGIGAANGVGA